MAPTTPAKKSLEFLVGFLSFTITGIVINTTLSICDPEYNRIREPGYIPPSEVEHNGNICRNKMAQGQTPEEFCQYAAHRLPYIPGGDYEGCVQLVRTNRCDF